MIAITRQFAPLLRSFRQDRRGVAATEFILPGTQAGGR